MKTINLLHFILFLGFLFITSCKGPEGETGPIGPQGTKGDTGAAGTNGTNGTNGKDGLVGTVGASGPAGAQGPTGNANVVYSEWLTPDWVSVGSSERYEGLKNSTTSMPLFTQDAIDKGVIYTYIRTGFWERNSKTGEYEIINTISLNSGNVTLKVPGRTYSQFYDFAFMNMGANTQIGVNYLNLTANLDKYGYDSFGKSGLIPEFSNKPTSFFIDLIKPYTQYRVVIVNGSTKGRLSNINMNNYQEVKKAFNLND
jgi:Collagen triple helix repeat (20 copies)